MAASVVPFTFRLAAVDLTAFAVPSLTFRFQQFLQIVPTMKHELRKMAEERMTSRLATMPMFKDLDSSQVCAVI